MRWRWARPVQRVPAGAAETVWVDDATLTPFRMGPMKAEGRNWRWCRGAVYDADGTLVPLSQRWWESDPQPAPVDPVRIRIPRHERRLDGSWVFAGHWADHFGHFLVETLPNVWPAEVEQTDGLVAMRPIGRPSPVIGGGGASSVEPRPWQRDLLTLAGAGEREVVVVRHKPVGVERLLVPERPVWIRHWVRPEAVAMWRRISEAVGERGTSRRVYFTRTAYNERVAPEIPHTRGVGHPTRWQRTDPSWDAQLDRAFAAAGFDIVAPEELTIAEQIALVRGAEVIAGSAGSAVHLSCFADPGTKVLEIGDVRSRAHRIPTQRAIDAACGHQITHLTYGDTDALAQLERIEEWPDADAPDPAISALRKRARKNYRAVRRRLRRSRH